MKDKHTHDHLGKKTRWDEQEEMQQHYGPVAFPVSGDKHYELEADAMAAKLTMSATELKYGQAAVKKLKDGAGLPLMVRKKMERLFKANFSNVRIFTGEGAATQNKQQSSRAFAVGEQIYFKPGQYNPYTLEGQRLLVHELTHVLQQRKGEKSIMMAPDQPPLTSQMLLKDPNFTAINNGEFSLSKGSGRKTTVTILQQALEGLGYATMGDEKGVFGDHTENAVRRFQENNGLKPDGVVGSNSVRMLDVYYSTGDRQLIGDASNMDSYLFKVPVLMTDVKEGTGPDAPRKSPQKEGADFLVKALAQMFKIGPGQAQALVESGWRWTNEYTPVSDADIKKIESRNPVLKNVTVKKEDYETIMGKQTDGPGSQLGVNIGGEQIYGKTAGEQEEDAYAALQHDLDRLFKVSAELYASYKTDKSSPDVLKGLTEAGFESVDDFAKTVKGFKGHFELYAVLQVFYLLESSRKETVIEKKRYEKDEGVQSLMNRLKEGLEPQYNDVDTQILRIKAAYKQRAVNAGYKGEDVDKDIYHLPDYGEIQFSAIDENVLKRFTHKDVREMLVIMNFFVRNVLATENMKGSFPPGTKGLLGDMLIKTGKPDNYVFTTAEIDEYVKTSFTELKDFELEFNKEEDFQIKFVNKNAVDYPILADPAIFEKLRLHTRNTSAGSLKKELGKASSNVLESITAMQEKFRSADNYEKVWELGPVLTLTQNKLHITKGSTPELIIQDKLADVHSAELWKSLGIAALGIGLAIASIFTAGATAAVLAVLSTGVSGLDLYREYSKYSFEKDAHNTNFDRKQALNDVDPSMLWVVIAAVGFGLDFLSVLKALKAVKVAGSYKTIVEKSAEEMRKVANEDAVKGMKGLAEGSKEADLVKQGLKESETKITDFETKIKKAIDLNPFAFTEEGITALMDALKKSPGLLDELDKLKGLFKVKPKSIGDIYRFYTGPGLAVIEDFPKLTRMVETAGITDEKLLAEIFTQRAVQKVMLDHAGDPKLIESTWQEFQNSKKLLSGPKSFSAYLETAGYDIKLTERTSLLGKLGREFTSWPPATQKLKLLETTEPDLARQVEGLLNDAGQSPFSPKLTKKLKEFFEKPLEIENIESATLEVTRADMQKQLHKVLGENAYDAIEAKKIMAIMKRSDSKAAVWDEWVKVATVGGDEFDKLLKNAEYKKIYEDLLHGVTPRKFAGDLSLEEEAIYKFYTNEHYYKFNQALLAKSKADDIVALEKLLNKTLDKLPSSPGSYARGIGKNEIDILNKLKIGDEIKYDNFLSTTGDQIISAKFIRNNIRKTGDGALIIVESKNAKNIAVYSDAQKEIEFLHKSKSTFILTEKLENRIVNSFEVTVDYAEPIYGTIYKLKEK